MCLWLLFTAVFSCLNVSVMDKCYTTEGDLDSAGHGATFEGEDLLQNSQDMIMTDDSIPCSEIDLNALNKVQ